MKKEPDKFNFWAILGGMLLGMLWAGPIMFTVGSHEAYMRAYKDMKENRIEQVMKSEFPHKWIELNGCGEKDGR